MQPPLKHMTILPSQLTSPLMQLSSYIPTTTTTTTTTTTKAAVAAAVAASLIHHPNTMNTSSTTTNMTTTTPSIPLSDDHDLARVPRHGFSLQDIQVLEIFLAIAVFIVIHSLRQRKHQGLPSWPLLGMLPSMIVGLKQTNMYDWLSEILCRQCGTFHFKGPALSNLKCVVTADPRNLEHLLKTKFSNFPKGDYFRNTLRDLLGDGIFNADDETWQRQRKTASIEFHSARFRQLTTESSLELVHKRLLPVLEESLKGSVPIDLQDVLLRLTFDNICMIAFGVDPGCLRPGLPEIPFARAFEKATEASVLRFVTPTGIWKMMRALNIGPERESVYQVEGREWEAVFRQVFEGYLCQLHPCWKGHVVSGTKLVFLAY